METAMNKELGKTDKALDKGAKNLKDTATEVVNEVKGTNDWKGKTEQIQENLTNGLQQGIDTIKNLKADDVKNYAADIGSRVRSVGSDAYADPVGFVKRYPVTSALALAGVGFIVGSMIRSRRNAA